MPALELRLTRTGALQGTPAYMAPEQWKGQEVGPATDQFAWSLIAVELLYGERAFIGDTISALAASVTAGRRLVLARGRSVPTWLRRLVERGLAVDPAKRWSSMAALLSALERGRSRARRWTWGGALALASMAAAGGYAAVRAQHDGSPPCQGIGDALAGVWDGARAQAGERAFAATGAPFSSDGWQRVKARLDDYAEVWTAESTRACEAHAAGSQSSRLFDMRTLCLAQRRVYFSALVDVLAVADRAVVENAVQATAALPSVESCADEWALMAVAPPTDPETRARVEALRGKLARVAAFEATGQYAQGLMLATEVQSVAENLRYPPLEAEAALGAGSLLMAVARAEAAESALTQALRVALEHGLDGLAAEAAAKRIFVVGDLLGRRAMALDAAPIAEALVARAHDEGRTAALLHNNIGTIHQQDGNDEQAHLHYLQTIDILARRAGAPDPLIAAVHHNLGGMFRGQGRLVEAREHYMQAWVLFSDLLGERHPLVAHPLGGLADVDVLEGQYADATARFIRALALMEDSYGPEHLYLIYPLVGLGRARAGVGELVDATGYLRRAVAIGERQGTNHPMFAEALEGLAERLVADSPEEARRLLARAATVHEAAGDSDDPASAAPAAILVAPRSM